MNEILLRSTDLFSFYTGVYLMIHLTICSTAVNNIKLRKQVFDLAKNLSNRSECWKQLPSKSLFYV
jgi:hypothetical protein